MKTIILKCFYKNIILITTYNILTKKIQMKKCIDLYLEKTKQLISKLLPKFGENFFKEI